MRDPATGVTVLAALAAGFVSFLSPCVLPLVPGYLASLSGSVEGSGSSPRRRLLLAGGLFSAGFSLVFVLLGLGATAVGQVLSDHQQLLSDLAGVTMIVFGVLFVSAPFVPRLALSFRPPEFVMRMARLSPVLAGAAFGLVWTPCVGPTLGAILSAAALSSSEVHGAVLLSFYSLGLAVPFLLCALAFDQSLRVFKAIKRHFAWVVFTGGAILIGMGVLVLTGELTTLNVEAQRLSATLGLSSVTGI